MNDNRRKYISTRFTDVIKIIIYQYEISSLIGMKQHYYQYHNRHVIISILLL